MYKSPIEIMTSSINYRLEEEVLKAVAKVDVDVNKDELVKALDYDRGQYEKGYADAKAEYEREQGEWIFDPEILCSDIGVYSAGYRCSVCGKDYFKVDRMNYCPNCGAKMKGADDEAN